MKGNAGLAEALTCRLGCGYSFAWSLRLGLHDAIAAGGLRDIERGVNFPQKLICRTVPPVTTQKHS